MLLDTLKALPQSAEEPSVMLDLRQRLTTLLADRMSTIRIAARFVFRRSPDIVREATSVYERRRGVAARRAKSEKKVSPPQSVDAKKGEPA